MAWCVEPMAVISLMELLKAGGTAVTPYDASATGSSSIEAIVTSPDTRSLINAQSIQIEAQTSEISGGSEVWRTVATGREQCNDCSNLELQTVPEGTQRLQVSIDGIPFQEKNSQLYLASIQFESS